jgi:SpoVK/Ycf46/Vps4 family AAA+-type ATPase
MRKAASLERGIVLRLERLAALFALSPFEVDALLVCLAPELDLKYERLYAYLQNDVTKKRPSVDLVLNLLCPSFETKLTARRYFAPKSPLVSWHLLRLFEDPSGRQTPLLGKFLKVDERVVDYLLGSDEIDARLSSFAQMTHPQAKEELILGAGIKGKLLQLAQTHRKKGLIFFFRGGYGVGKRTMAEALCRGLGSGLLVVDLARMLEEELPFEAAVRLVFREALLQDAALYWEHFDILLEESKEHLLDVVVQGLEIRSGLSFITGERVWEPVGALHEVPLIRVEFPIPPYEERKRLWEVHLDGRFPVSGDVDIGALANKFHFSGGQICDAVATARNLALGRGEGRIAMADLYKACRAHSNQKLKHLARKIRPHYTWADIVLPPDQMRQLREIVNYVKYRPLVYGDWGFDRKLSLSKGLNALFAGPPGTGKTMAAEIIAGELGLDLYKIDLSMVVSRYIGETEKNLNRIFKEAETSNSILFFDEADALFGKRSEVRDSHDRYANIEIAYLLQKMEEYEGIVILATNLRQNLDEAFVRRMHFTVEFPFPEEEYRRRIWEVTFPPEAPRADDIDFDFLARNFKLAGGNIRNIILSAAFLAAEDGRVIGMEHLIRATKREFQKMGKLVVEGDFGSYYELVRA